MRCLYLALCSALMVAGCSGQAPKTTAGLDNSVPLTRNKDAGALVYRSPTLQFGKYKSMLVENAAIKEIEGKGAAFVGSVTISGEMIDTQSGEVLGAFVATESPIALDVTSGLSSLRAAELGISRGADNFADSMDRALGRAR